ncbi:MAG: hypothetical protein IT173_09255 [Acidobacteria bacterium]|nr:hypothetical protein [Acidobacteriota bacterium]
MKSIATLTVLVSFFAVAAFAQNRQVESIDIKSTWGGLGAPQSSHIIVVRKGSEFIANGKRIDPDRVGALIKALEESDLEKPSLENLGMTRSWLIENARKCVSDCISGYIDRANLEQRQLFFTKFTDQKFAQKMIEGMFHSLWTDDYPRFEARIRFSEGADTNISSVSQSLYMIPWCIEDGAKVRTTYNAHVSMALASILPSKFTNLTRLGGIGLAERLASSVLGSTEAEWKRLEVIEKVKDAVTTFEKDYEILSMELNSYHDSDFGVAWDGKEPSERNLHILIRKRNYPEGLALKLILPVENGKVQNIEFFKQKIDSYLSLVNAVPWLKHFIDTSGKSVWLRFVGNRSFSEKGFGSFREDMKALGKADVVSEVEKVQDKVAVLSIGGGLEYFQSFWLILPDGRSVVWRQYYVSPLPQLTFVGKECAENRSNTKPCVGALISREGEILQH